MDSAQWPQGIGLVNKLPMEGSRSMLERRAASRPQKDQALNCPRCNSTNTKFCYYNNYSLTQPRYFCKTCRRYWTEGGSLRNVPVGGGSRKNKRSSSLSSSAAAAVAAASSQGLSKKFGDLTTPPTSYPQSAASQNPKIHEAGQDLNLSYPPSDDFSTFSKLAHEAPAAPPYDTENKVHNQNIHHLTATELLKTAVASRGFTSFLSIPSSDSNATYPTGFPLQEFKPTLNFSLEGFEGGYGSLQQGVQATGARLLFPVGEVMKQQQVPSGTSFEQNRGGQGEPTPGYWTGLLGGGSW